MLFAKNTAQRRFTRLKQALYIKISPLQIPSDRKDGFFAAFWKRPEAYLSSQVRQVMPPFSKIKKLSEGLQKLEDDLASGVWVKNNHAILGLSSLAVGYRIISAKVRSSDSNA